MGNDFYEVTTAPSGNPVTLDEAKLWCKVTHTVDNDLITALIVAATQKAELFTNRVFISRTYLGKFEGLDCSNQEKGYFLEIRRAPLISVTSINVMENESQETVSTDDYNVKETHSFSRIIFETLNESPDLIQYPYEVVFLAGYGVAAAVPEPIKLAIKEAVCFWYQNRGDCDATDELPAIAKAILKEYRIVNTFG